MGGSSKQQTIGYKFRAGIHMILSHGPIDAIKKILVDDTKTLIEGDYVAGSYTISKADLFGGESSQGGISGTLDILDGSVDQQQNGYLKRLADASDQEQKYVPAYRGVASLILHDQYTYSVLKTYINRTSTIASTVSGSRGMYLGMNPYLKTWKTLIQRIHKTSDGSTQWYDEKAAITDISYFFEPQQTMWKYKTVNDTDTTSYLNVSKTDWLQGASPFGNKYLATTARYGFPTTPTTLITQQKILWAETTINVTNTEQDFIFECYVDNGIDVWVNGTHVLTYRSANGVFYLNQTIDQSYFNTGSNRITIKCIDDGLGVREGNWIWFDLRLHGSFTTYYDMNPAHIIRECFTNDVWGMGRPESEIDDVAFKKAADTLYAEGLGMSITWTQESAIETFLEQIRNHINAVIYEDPKTGLTVLKLIRDDYDASALLTLNESHIKEVSDFQRSTFSELMNQITVTYTNIATGENGTITVQDTALVAMQNEINSKSVEYKGFSNISNASKVAMRDLKIAATPLISAELQVMRSVARNFRQGDVFKWSWGDYKVDQVVMRVLAVDLGNGKSNTVTLTCTQDIFAMPESTMTAIQPSNTVSTQISPITAQIAFDVPYLELVQRQGQSAVDAILANNPQASFFGVACGRPNTGVATQNAQLYLKSDASGNYLRDSNLDFCPTFTTLQDIGYLETEIVTASSTDFGLIDPAENLPVWAQLDDELVSITQISADDTGQLVLTVKRGVLDTVPAKHTAHTVGYVWDVMNGGSTTEHVETEQISAKLIPSSLSQILDQSKATVLSATMQGRAYRPYPPANVKINAEYYPEAIQGELALTWNHRNRIQQTGGDYLGWVDGAVTLETGTEYLLSIEAGTTTTAFDTLLDQKNIGSVSSYTFADFDKTYIYFKITLQAIRGGYHSYQSFQHSCSRSDIDATFVFRAQEYVPPPGDAVNFMFGE